ncbi:uncharacterized protein N7496_002630 [Penicillium cataractarum]|uniref:Uncharacterized protein n=1 Tax=Penicillium cataractarum TaxID=2100454 RepID=A0A9W9VFN6_9EURO|nr:uncharacterized protein N7496_002630 [Penicillium cataractarum]KAJ5380202.1 hypothetical protein N7496_002630 [Penicillium cataractarum]
MWTIRQFPQLVADYGSLLSLIAERPNEGLVMLTTAESGVRAEPRESNSDLIKDQLYNKEMISARSEGDQHNPHNTALAWQSAVLGKSSWLDLEYGKMRDCRLNIGGPYLPSSIYSGIWHVIVRKQGWLPGDTGAPDFPKRSTDNVI